MRNSVNRLVMSCVVFILVLGLIVPVAEPVNASAAAINLGTNDNAIGSARVTTAADGYEEIARDLEQIQDSGPVWAWGRNNIGMLGIGTANVSSLIPMQTLNISDVMAVAGGQYHSLALKSDGTAWSWGEGAYGQLGNGSPYDEYAPVPVSNLSGIIDIACGWNHSLAVTSNGTAWAWGKNTYGQLGIDTYYHGSQIPVPVSNLSGVTAVTGGEDHSLALMSDKTVWGWGKNWFGQLGNGTTNTTYVPAQVSNLGNVTAIATGGAHSLALKEDGTVWAWGDNSRGQLGGGTGDRSYVPVQVNNLSGVKAIACGQLHSLALASDGSVWAWGYNKYGQLGDGTTDNQYTPVPVTGLGGIHAIAAGQYHSVAVNEGGDAFAWGYNIFGQLGDGTNAERHTPVPVTGLPDVFTVGSGLNHSLAAEGQPEVEMPDLIITDVWNENNYIHYQIRNIGESTASAGHYTCLFIDNVELSQAIISVELAPGARLKDSFSGTWQYSLPEHTIKVCADNGNVIGESNETNNCREEIWKGDVTAPNITDGPTVSGITHSAVTVSWQTDEISNSVVQYSMKAGAYSTQADNANLVTGHVITIDNLVPSAIYNYIVKSTDGSGNTRTSAAGFFETGPVTDSEAPVVSGLTVTRSATEFLCYELNVTATDDVGISKVEFYLDDKLIGTDYSEPYEYQMAPFSLGVTRENLFYDDHVIKAIAFDFSGGQTQLVTLPSWVTEMAPIHLEVTPTHHLHRYVDGPADVLPDGETITVWAHTYEYELETEMYKGIIVGMDEVIQAVHLVTFDPSNSGKVPRSEPDYGYDYDYSYTWNVGGLGVGTHSIEVKAIANDGSYVQTVRNLYVEAGEPSLEVSRSVTRIDNYFQVELVVENVGHATTELDKIKDNADNFQPLRKRSVYRGYEVSTNSTYSDSGVNTIIDINLFSDSGESIALAPGENVTISYLAVPVLSADAVDYGFGLSDIEVFHPDGSVETFDRPCSSTDDGTTLSNALVAAKAESDFLIITNAERLFALYPQADVCDLLTAMADLARLKNGILGYVPGRNKNVVHDTIKDWGIGMKGSDGIEGNFLKSGYLLIVGESEIIGSWTVYIGSYDDVKYSDLPFANTEGEFRNPELIVGRIIGNDASKLILPIQYSINVYTGELDFDWDRTQALVVSGKGDGASVFEDDADEIAELLDDEFPIVTTLKQRDIEDDGGNILAEFKAHDGDTDVVVYRDHGWPTNWTDVIYRDDFGGTDPVDFESSKPFVFAICCWAGRYEDEDINDDDSPEGENGIAEKFLEHGAAVYIGSTQISKRYKNGAAAENFFDRWVDSTDSVGKAFRNLKRDFNGTQGKRYWISEYNLYGDPKYGSSTTVAPPGTVILAMAAPESQTSFNIVIPDFEVSVTVENEDRVRIPGGDMIIEEGRPLLPYYTVSFDYPLGQRVQDVLLTARSGMTAATGLNIPVATDENDLLTIGNYPSGNDDAWWPDGAYAWEIIENADGTSTLIIEIYPFYYNALTTDVRFYKNYSFDIHVSPSAAEIVYIDTDRNEYAQGDDVLIDLWVENSGDAQDVIVSAVVMADSTGEAVDGLLMQNLKGLSGTASFSPEWNSSGFEPGYYYIDVTVRDTVGNVLDRRMEMFRLGIHSGEITGLTATPQNFDIGDNVNIALDFSNTGSLNISGTVMVKIQDLSGSAIETFSGDITGLVPGNAIGLNYVWDTAGVEDVPYRIIGYVLFDSGACEPVCIIVNGYNNPPVADANGPYIMDEFSVLMLDASGSYDPDAASGDSIVAFEWDLDNDGYFDDAVGEQPVISWSTMEMLGIASPADPATGETYHVIGLRVTDSFGESDIDITELRIYTNEPLAAFTAVPNPAAPAQVITFDAGASSHSHPGHTIVLYEWDFDNDGTFDASATDPIITHSYSFFGSYTAILRVTDDSGKTDSTSAIIDINMGNHPPVANAGGPYMIDEGSPVTLDASASYDPDAAFGDYIVVFEWDLDNDGYFDDAVGMTAMTVFNDDGLYTVGLRVTDSFGESATAIAPIAVNDLGPASAFTWSPEPQDEGSPVSFDDLSTSSPDTIVSWAWDFGGLGTSTDQNPSFVFSDNGIYTVTLTVTDDDGSADSVSHDVTINDLGPAAAFTWSPEPQNEGSTVSFNDMSTSYPDTIVSWAWDFGGLGTSTDQHPSFVFSDNGIYTVTLSVTDDDGSTDSVSHDVSVTDLGPTAVLSGDTTLNEGQTGSYDASGSASGPDTIVLYEWDWSYDGITFNPSGDTSALQTHVWTGGGIYMVAVRVTDDDGSTDIAALTVSVASGNNAPVAFIDDIDDSVIPLPVTIKVTPQTLNLDRLGNWVKVHINDDIENTPQQMEVVLDGSDSFDPDGDPLFYQWILTGPDGEIPLADNVSVQTVTLSAGAYTVVLVVSDGINDSSPYSIGFTLRDFTLDDVSEDDPGVFTLNGVPACELKKNKKVIILSFDDEAIAGTVDVGLDVAMILEGPLSGVDYIDVIRDKGKSKLK